LAAGDGGVACDVHASLKAAQIGKEVAGLAWRYSAGKQLPARDHAVLPSGEFLRDNVHF
jgi:hypothetical protein